MTNGLFKYFSTDEDKIERFTKGQVYLTPPRHLNDPWDFLMRSEPPTEELLKREVPFLHPEDVPGFLTQMSTSQSLEEGARELQERLSKKIGVVCLTAKPLDRLMWAHYGESHKGFVAEFGRSGDEGKTEYGFRCCGSPFGSAVEVQYEPELPLLQPGHPNLEKGILTKYDCWVYEEEWRVIRPLDSGDAHPTKQGFVLARFKPIHLRRVIFGLRAPPELKFRLRQMLNHMEFEHVRTEEVYIDPNWRQLDSRPSA
jgi:hypothetical protein